MRMEQETGADGEGITGGLEDEKIRKRKGQRKRRSTNRRRRSKTNGRRNSSEFMQVKLSKQEQAEQSKEGRGHARGTRVSNESEEGEPGQGNKEQAGEEPAEHEPDTSHSFSSAPSVAGSSFLE